MREEPQDHAAPGRLRQQVGPMDCAACRNVILAQAPGCCLHGFERGVGVDRVVAVLIGHLLSGVLKHLVT